MGANSFTRLAGPTTPARRERQREARAPTPFAPSHVQVAYRPATAYMVRVSPFVAVLATATGSAAGIRFRNSSTGHQQHCPSHVGSPLLAMLHFAARFPRYTQPVRSYLTPRMRSAPPLPSKHSIASALNQLPAEGADAKSSCFTFCIRPFFCPLVCVRLPACSGVHDARIAVRSRIGHARPARGRLPFTPAVPALVFVGDRLRRETSAFQGTPGDGHPFTPARPRHSLPCGRSLLAPASSPQNTPVLSWFMLEAMNHASTPKRSAIAHFDRGAPSAVFVFLLVATVHNEALCNGETTLHRRITSL